MFVVQIRPGPQDRLGLTISIAILVHALIIFGISFTKEEWPSTRMNTMEIVLINQETKMPEESNVLAQKNLEGGGETEEIFESSTQSSLIGLKECTIYPISSSAMFSLRSK